MHLNQFNSGPGSYLQFSGRIVPDAGLAIGRRIKVDVLEALDSRGNRLGAPANTLDHLSLGESARPGVWYSFAIAAPAEDKPLQSVRLRIQLLCERKRGDIDFDELTAGQEKRSGEVAVKLVSVLPSSAGEYQVTLEAKGVPGQPWLEHKGIALRGANGKDWQIRGAYIGNKADGVSYQFYYSDPGGAGEPKSLRFPAVIECFNRVIHAEFREVPLR